MEIKKLVIANRGEIARRILKAGKEKSFLVAVISTPEDSDSLVRLEADHVIEVSSFLNAREIVEASQAWGANLLHPGYGFLSENAEFAKLVEQAGISFVGPTSENMLALGSKEAAKRQAQQCNVPSLNALFSAELKNIPEQKWEEELTQRHIFAPYLVKASGGGGGRGMRIVEQSSELKNAILRASQEAKASFNDDTVFIESYLKNPRHIEIQVFGDGKGGGVFFGERECSLQRRHQKVLEEAPSSVISHELRAEMGKKALQLVRSTKYRGAGTCEFLLDANKNFYFLEMNTRLQVEHPVTEMVYQVDLVHAQLDLACGIWPENLPSPNEDVVLEPQGVALEARILAEDPRNQFFPAGGSIVYYLEPQGAHVRVDSGVTTGNRINTSFDSMVAKLIVHAPTRAEACAHLKKALSEFAVLGVTTNIPFLHAIVAHPDFLMGEESTSWIGDHLESLNRLSLSPELAEFLKAPAFCQVLSRAILGEKPLSGVNAIFAQQEQTYFTVTRGLSEHQFVLNLNKKKTEFLACRVSENEMHLFVLGEYLFLPFGEQSQAKGDDVLNASGEINSPMAGKVFDILVEEGSTVEQNQVLFIVESMKMQLEVKSPKSGVLAKIHVQKGQILPGPNLMAEVQ